MTVVGVIQSPPGDADPHLSILADEATI